MGDTERLLWGLASVIALGIGAQWLAWRLRLPAILLLLTAGFVAGPVSGQLNVNEIFGDLLIPFVSLCVALILFEGGLNLRFAELRSIGGALARLLTVGVAVTWLLAAGGAFLLLGLPVFPSLLLGAILVVTGPTVIGPLLRHIRPVGDVAAIAKWEGITIDPVGAVLAVLVFEAGVRGAWAGASAATMSTAASLLLTILAGTVSGGIGAAVLILLLKRFWIPDHLQSPVALAIAVVSFVAANHFQHEAGLLAVTVLGVLVANLSQVPVKQIIEFKENLSVLLVSILFIILAARVTLDDLTGLGWNSAAFVAGLILIVRPASVWLATWGTTLSLRERMFLSWLAPRGIVAVAISSVFALRLEEHGSALAANVLVVVVVTVTIYGLTAGLLARRLGLAENSPQGVLLVGAYAGARAIAHALIDAGFRVVLLDNNHWHIREARMEGLTTYFGNAIAEDVADHLPLGGIGRMIALTSNEGVNALAAHEFGSLFGRAEVYQLAAYSDESPRTSTPPAHLRGRPVFGDEVTFESLQQRFADGAVVKATPLTEEFDFDDLRARHGEDTLPLFVVSEKKTLSVVTADSEFRPRAGQTVICLVTPLKQG